MTQHLRHSQFVITYGPGALVESINGPRIIPMPNIGLFTSRSGLRPEDYEISDKRIRQLLGNVKIYRLPSNAELRRSHEWYIYATKPFPEWKLCLKMANHGNYYVLYKGNRCPVCKDRQGGGWEAIRFIVACPKGHMDEVDWYSIVHGFSSTCEHTEWFRWYGGGGSLSEVRIQCPSCGSGMFSLGDAYGRSWRCSGRFPEREGLRDPPYRPGCSEEAKIIQRQASNLHIPRLITMFSVSPHDTRLHNLLQISPIYDAILGLTPSSKSELRRILLNLVKGNRISRGTAEEILKWDWDEIRRVMSDVLNPSSSSYNELIIDEFHSLIEGTKSGIPPLSGSDRQTTYTELNPNDVVTVKVGTVNFRVAPVPRLRTVIVQQGYIRAVGGLNNIELIKVSFTDHTDCEWYPGVEFFGEGIFIIFDEEDGWAFSVDGETAQAWKALHTQAASYPAHVFRDSNRRVELHPAFVWWHTLSHAVIRAIAAEAGYSSASIRERVYFEVKGRKTRGGILLYATQPGSEGTLGGLIALIPYFSDILETAFGQLEVCSGDPLCLEQRVGIGSYNGAACYGCLLLSETSCEHRNMWLDRNIVLENRP